MHPKIETLTLGQRLRLRRGEASHETQNQAADLIVQLERDNQRLNWALSQATQNAASLQRHIMWLEQELDYKHK